MVLQVWHGRAMDLLPNTVYTDDGTLSCGYGSSDLAVALRSVWIHEHEYQVVDVCIRRTSNDQVAGAC